MREFKFRYYDQLEKEYVYSSGFKNLALFFEHFQLAVDAEVKPILEQHVGLEGVDFYEGDIIKNGDRVRIIRWDPQNATFCIQSEYLLHPIFKVDDIIEFERIGNIH